MSLKAPICCVPIHVAKTFIKECISAAGASVSHADDMANLLVTADNRGHFSHGLNRLEMYVKDLEAGITSTEGEPHIEKETPATAMVDGRNLLGPAVGKFCMSLAIKKAKECGIGWVVARHSNHYSIAGYYALMAANDGLIGMSMTNTSPLVVGTRAKAPTLGTNPLSFVAPGKCGDNFALDMATSTVALGKIELQHRKGESMPNGWGADPHGRETNNPGEVLDGGALLPLGGSEISGGYKVVNLIRSTSSLEALCSRGSLPLWQAKRHYSLYYECCKPGYGLAMMVETMCGILSGSMYGPNIRKWGKTNRIADLGQCFIAVDPNAFCGGFEERMQDLMDTQRNLNPTEKEKPVLVAGDPEREHIRKCEEIGGIPYPRNVVDHMNEVGKRLSVEQMTEVIPKKE